MEDPDDTNYAPQSPDLSATAIEPHPQHREYRGSVSHISPFTPTSEIKTPFGFPPQSPVLSNYPPQLPQSHSQPSLFYNNQQQPPPPHFAAPAPLQPHSPQLYNPYFPDTTQHQFPQGQYAAQIPPQHHYPQSPYQYHPQVKQEDSYGDDFGSMPAARASKKMKKEEDADAENNAPGVREGIEVRTKFPVARIKRIMQADEDVGKVAQVTPVVVSKALELFMISLVTKAAAQARERGSKRVLAAHLKQAVLDDDQFDYLQEIVSKVAEAPSKNADKHEDSDDAMEGGSGTGGKKKRAAGGSRRKRKDSDEF